MGLREAITEQSKWDKTWNGADALKTTGSPLLDMFGRAGSMRGCSTTEKELVVSRAYKVDPEAALKLLFYVRDIRGGYGERDTFRTMLKHMANMIPVESMEKNLWAIMEFGRADDLYALIGTRCEDIMWAFMKNQFELDYENMKAGKSVSLLAKWIATPDSKVEKTKELGKLTAKKLGYPFKNMREFKVKLRELRRYIDIPEAKMCAGKWEEIEYSKCASKFLFKYRKIIQKHDQERWNAYINSVDKGEANMNMGTVTPADIIYQLRSNYTSELETMWKQLDDVCKANALVMCDTSGSMLHSYYCKGNIKPIDVAFGLALYFAQRNVGDLKDMMLNFSDSPMFIELNGTTLMDNYRIASGAPVNYSSTNLEGAFILLLDVLKKGSIKPEEMPQAILIVSDMQINCVDGIGPDNKLTFYGKMNSMYMEAGFEMPQVVFWNVNAQNATFHADASTSGVSLVSGFSPNVFKQVMENVGTSPMELMLAVLNSERYKDIKM